MARTIVEFATVSWAWGRSGGMGCRGLEFFPIEIGDAPYVEICPINKKGETSGSLKIHIPFEDVDAVYNALGKVRDEVREKLKKPGDKK